jgi:hypothetical protein
MTAHRALQRLKVSTIGLAITPLVLPTKDAQYSLCVFKQCSEESRMQGAVGDAQQRALPWPSSLIDKTVLSLHSI